MIRSVAFATALVAARPGAASSQDFSADIFSSANPEHSPVGTRRSTSSSGAAFHSAQGSNASASGSAGSASLRAANFPVVEHTLPNGLQVRLLKDSTVPTVSYYTFYKVGSRNERPGLTGISHLFEHMMFNGTEKYGPKEFDRQLESRGGYSNAYTSSDVTAYYEDFDREALSLVVDLESDRMHALQIVPEVLESEREVVKEERRFRVDNDIGGMMDEELDSLAWSAHPYTWPVIGWMSDLDRISREDCLDFFARYYAPNNALIVVVGDIDVQQTLGLIEEAYGGIPAGPPIPEVPNDEPEQRGQRWSQIHHPAQSPVLALGYKAVAAAHPDAVALDILQVVLAVGEGSRLQRRLVREKELLTQVWGMFEWRIDDALFKFGLDLPPGGDVHQALVEFDKVIEDLQNHPISEKEVQRARNMIRGQSLRLLGTNNGIAHALGEHEFLFSSWKSLFETLERYEAVSAEDVQRVAQTYLTPKRRSVVELVPEDFEGELDGSEASE